MFLCVSVFYVIFVHPVVHPFMVHPFVVHPSIVFPPWYSHPWCSFRGTPLRGVPCHFPCRFPVILPPGKMTAWCSLSFSHHFTPWENDGVVFPVILPVVLPPRENDGVVFPVILPPQENDGVVFPVIFLSFSRGKRRHHFPIAQISLKSHVITVY